MKIIKLTNGYEVKVSNKDYKELNKHNWYAKRTKAGFVYAAKLKWDSVNKKRGTEFMHRRIMGAKGGEVVDHVDHNTLNNMRSNLRLVTYSQNAMNRLNKNSNLSRKTGVIWHKSHQKWMARITENGNSRYLGYYDNVEDAIKARENAEIKYFGKYKNK